MYLKKELYSLIQSDESIFDFIQESLLDGLWYWDLENPENEWMNARFWTVLGYNPDEMPHNPAAWQSIINQDDLKLASHNFTRHCENPNHPYDQVVRYTHKNGSTVWIRCRGMAIRDKTGKPIRMLGAHQNVTELKLREQELSKANEKVRESEEKYRAFYNNAPLSYQSLDENGCFIDINPTWLKTLGYERDEVIGKWYGDFLHPDYVEHFRINFPAFKKRGYVSDVQFKLRRKDNTYIYVSFEGCVGYTPEGKFKQTYCVFKDITEQKALENAIIKARQKAEESEARYRLIADNTSDSIWVMDADLRFTYLSPSTEMLFGYTPLEWETLDWNIFVSPGHLENVFNAFGELKSASQRKLNPQIASVRHKNGTEMWVEFSANAIFDKNEVFTGAVGITRDVTEHKLAEEALRKSESKFNALFSSMSEMVVLHELVFNQEGKPIDYRITDCNNAFTKITGIRRENAIGRLSTEVYGTEEPPYFREFSEVAFTGKPYHYETYFKPMNKHFSISVISPEKNRFATVTTDITELKQSELLLQGNNEEIAVQNEELSAQNEELYQANQQIIAAIEKAEESEEKFRKSIEFSPVPMAVAKNNGDLLFLNKQFVESFGYSIKELGSIQKWFELAYPDVEYRNSRFNQWSSDVDFSAKNRVPAPVREGLITCKNGVVKTVEISVSIEKEIFIGLFQDITERKNKEEKIREKDLQFRKLSANVPDLIYQFTRKPDGAYCIPVSSDGIKNIFGCSPEDVIDDFAPVARVIFPEDAERVIRDIEYSAAHLTYFTCEFRVQIPGKPVQWIFSRSTPEKLPDGSITWYGFNADITERKHNEHALMAKMDELERFHKLTIGRETTMVELKKEVNSLLNKLGEDNKYRIIE